VAPPSTTPVDIQASSFSKQISLLRDYSLALRCAMDFQYPFLTTSDTTSREKAWNHEGGGMYLNRSKRQRGRFSLLRRKGGKLKKQGKPMKPAERQLGGREKSFSQKHASLMKPGGVIERHRTSLMGERLLYLTLTGTLGGGRRKLEKQKDGKDRR